MYRFKKGSGLPLRVPVVDLIEIGAGGGSIVRVDGLGLVKVGPDSVGRRPWTRLLRPRRHASNRHRCRPRSRLSGPGIVSRRPHAPRYRCGTRGNRHSCGQAAWGFRSTEAALRIHDIVNENMANASRIQAVERGHDPTGYSLVAFGGAGPVHAWGVATRLRLGTVIVPPSAGLGSAVGLLACSANLPHRAHAYRHAGRARLVEDRALVRARLQLKPRLSCAMPAFLPIGSGIRAVSTCDIAVSARNSPINVPNSKLAMNDGRTLHAAFERAYARVYHRTHAGHPVEALAWRLAATGPAIQRPASASRMKGRTRTSKPRHWRSMLLPGAVRDTRLCVFSRYDLTAGMTVRGPAVIEEPESTTVIGPRGSAAIDDYGNLVIELPYERTR